MVISYNMAGKVTGMDSDTGQHKIFTDTDDILMTPCLTSPDQTKWRIKVDNNGVLSTEEVI